MASSVTATDLLDGSVGYRGEEVRFDVLDWDGNVVDVVHPTKAGSIAWTPSNRISRTLTGVVFNPAETVGLIAGYHRIAPKWVLASGDEYPVGHFFYMGGSADELAGGTWMTAAPMPDRSQVLAQKISDMIGIASGTVVTDAIRTTALGGGIPASDIVLQTASTVVGSTPLTFAIGNATRLDVEDALTDLVGFLPVYFNNSGQLIGRPIPVPADAAPDFVYYQSGQKSRVIADSVKTQNRVTSRPNVYLVRSTSPTNAAISGRYDVPKTSTTSANLPYEIVDVVDVAGLADSTQAQAIAAARAKRDAAKIRVVTFASVPDPRHDGWNVVEWEGDPMLETSWTLELGPGGKQTHTLVSVYST